MLDAQGRKWSKWVEFVDVEIIKGRTDDSIRIYGKTKVFYSLEDDKKCEVMYSCEIFYSSKNGLETRNQEMSYWEQGAEWLPVPEWIDRDPSFRMVPYHVLGIPV
jgi:hypothetical protein